MNPLSVFLAWRYQVNVYAGWHSNPGSTKRLTARLFNADKQEWSPKLLLWKELADNQTESFSSFGNRNCFAEDS